MVNVNLQFVNLVETGETKLVTVDGAGTDSLFPRSAGVARRPEETGGGNQST